MMANKRRMAYFSSLIMLGLTLLAAWLRLWRLDSIPPGLWFDESFNGMEVVWMLKTQTWPVFILGGQGREVMFHYLLALSISVLDATVYALRLVPALLGVLSIPLMYRWALTLFTNRSTESKEAVYWIALLSAGGVAVSFWLLVMNRVSYRANTLLPVMIVTSYFFWQGWQTGKIRYYLLAGVGLGLCQYTYLAGRLVPLVFVVFVCAQTFLGWRTEKPRLKMAWLGLLIMAGVAALVFTPLLLIFVQYPELFWERSGDVALEINQPGAKTLPLAEHLVSAVRVFVDGQDPNWRHHLLGRPVFDWFSILGFWIGLPAVIKQYRQPANLFLLSMLGVMWLPALLSEPAFHTLRLVGILPAYYVIAAIGLINLANWLSAFVPTYRLASSPPRFPASSSLALVALLLLSGGVTVYDYFYRWAERPEVYYAFEGQVVELANYLASSETETSWVMPFYLYGHASMRYILQDQFKESVILPADVATRLSQSKKVNLIMPEYPADDRLPPALVWLVKTGPNAGTAYVSAVRRDLSLAGYSTEAGRLIKDSQGQVMARQYPLDPQAALSLFPQEMPGKKAAVAWADNLLLSGYEFRPTSIEAGNASQLYLSWKILSYTGLEEQMFLQLLDSRGNPVGQQEIEPISRKMYRWRDDGLILEQHPLQLDSDLAAGLYFARLGFFNPDTGQRLPAYTPTGQPLGDELIVGPLYVSANGVNPTSPQHPIQARLGHEFQLLGYSTYPAEAENSTAIELFWKADAPVEVNYTVFVQMLDAQNQIIAQADAQPLPNVYPTSRWQPGDVLSERFVLPVTKAHLAAGSTLVTGMYDLSTGARLPAYTQQGDVLPDGLVQLVAK